ncbi:phosphatidylinositol transfer protein CSR1 isoform X3 [Sesamum indicum]|uniref:Phosphatidylinositol transfer protein CSR1 isoform X3 n=1 Tax=Sesamum indicum TaxID=4182 RepID=A0A6I9SPG7_SESIN|nr:phosphatidylinositol transfer protein CSR1 isoform X3 [Sesamum indicum]
MAHCLRLRPPLPHHFKPVSIHHEKPTNVFKLSIRSCFVAPEKARRGWRKEFGVSELSEESVKSAAETGKAYLHSHLDVYGRPVLIVEARKHFPGEQGSHEDQKLCVFLIEKALTKLPAGKQEILVIIDLRGFQTQNADIKFTTFVFDAFYNYYPKRLSQVLFVDAPFIFKPVWQLIKPLLKSYASLVRFCSAEAVRDEYFTEDTVPANFRG